MKNYHFKLILTFYVISAIVVFIAGICLSISFRALPNSYEIIMQTLATTLITMAILAIISITMALIIYKKIVEPMSRMLRSANPYDKLDYLQTDDEDLDEVIEGLRKDLIAANNQKKQTDTILKHMTDGVIAFDMDGKVTDINAAEE